jgi:S-adenosylmethionine hydrolase
MSSYYQGVARAVVLSVLAFVVVSTLPAHAQSGSLSGRIWLDRDGFGSQEPGEPGLAGVTVDLLDVFGTPLAATTTDAGGDYSFSSLSSADYTVRVGVASLPGGIVQTMDPDMTRDGETTVTLGVDEVLGGLDFGYQGTGTLAGLVFYDQDADGSVDEEDFGVSDAEVTVTDGAQVTITTFSTPTGTYNFDGLPAGTYTVSVDPDSVFLNPASDPDGVADNQTTVALAAGQSRFDLYFGYSGDGVLGDRVFLDLDGDGFQEPGEPGLAGVGVELLDDLGTLLDGTTTSAGGLYQFAALTPNVYTVRIDASTLPAGVSPTADHDGFLDGESTYSLVTAEVFDGLDFGYAGAASAGDQVFFDLDGDGFQGPGEDGIDGVTLELTDVATGEVASTATDADGFYIFTGLPDLTWNLAVDSQTLPAGANQVTDPDGILDNQTLVATQNGLGQTDLDFGYNFNGSIGDRVFLDNDQDGTQNAGDTGFEGIQVQLLDLFGTPLATTTTDASGFYSFANLVAGDYTVRVLTEFFPGVAFQTVDPDGFFDSETAVTLATGETYTDADFGYYASGGIDAFLWEDSDGNGIQNGFEQHMIGITVALLDDQGTPVDVQLTDTLGYVTFFDLPAGSYSLVVDDTTLPPNFAPTFDSDGLATPHTIDVTIATGEFNFGSAFGYIGPGTITAHIWEDENGDGIEDGAEPRMSGVSVALLDDQGNTVDVNLTDLNGNITFFDLLEGSYTLVVDDGTLPPFYTQTFDSDGLATPHRVDVTIAAGENHFGSAFAYIGPGTITAHIWEDENGDGIEDGGEPRMSGVSVALLDDQGITVDVNLTDLNGNITFFDLLAGSYTLVVDDGTLPPFYTQTFDSDGLSTPHSVDVSIVPGEDHFGSAFAYIGPGTITAHIWEDENGDGIEDFGAEPRMSGVSVALLDDQGITVDVNLTDLNGNITFFDLLAGSYTLVVDDGTLPPFYTQTFDSDGLSTPHSVDVSIVPGEDHFGSAFAYIGPGTITAHIWEDENGDGIEDFGAEPRMSGVSVALLDDQGITVDVNLTDLNGNITFFDLLAGAYTLVVDDGSLPPFYTQTFDSDGLSTPHGVGVAIVAGEDHFGSAFAYIGPGTITAYIWEDENGNGIEDGTEPRMSGVSVALLDDQGITVDGNLTDLNGNITFFDLLAGSYTLLVDDGSLPPFYTQTFDSDGLSTPHGVDVSIVAGEDHFGSAFAYIGPGTITARIWEDSNGNGLDDGEPPFLGVTVLLEDDLGNTVDIQATDSGGNVTFFNLLAGAYRVVVDYATLPTAMTPTFDSDGTGSPHTVDLSLVPGEDSVGTTFGYTNFGPSVTITAPADGTTVNDGAAVNFTGTASDTEDGDITAAISWTSSIDGALGTGGSVNATLSVGTHTITATVTDSGGLPASDVITVHVNGGPSVTITAPANGTTVNDGTAVNFTGTASDNEDGDLTAAISWTSSIDGALGTGGSVNATLSVGTHTITATVTDSGGLPASDVITVNVNGGPSVTITAPADGTTVNDGAAVNFTGTASDTEDGDLTAAISWTSSIDGALGTGGSVNATLSVGTHTITATVTDSGGLPASDVITVHVLNPPVTVVFTSIGGEDGWVRESSENSNAGGASNSGGGGSKAIRPGDANGDRQYKSILSFDTSAIPDGATIVEARFRLVRGGGQGTDPFDGGFGQCLVDVNSGGFSGSNALQASDFQASATAVAAAVMPAAPNQLDVSEGVLDAAGLAAVNVAGTTQIRVYFEIGDNDDGGNDFAGFYSGDTSNFSRRPQLEVTYQE